MKRAEMIETLGPLPAQLYRLEQQGLSTPSDVKSWDVAKVWNALKAADYLWITEEQLRDYTNMVVERTAQPFIALRDSLNAPAQTVSESRND